jgi:endonuclease/exonuclease/phosphatase family metal-dependent hydrolase
MHRVAVIVSCTGFQFGCTHFTWTPDGNPNEAQRHDLAVLLDVLKKYPELVLCGDFNIPRASNELYRLLAERYTDHVPPEIHNSLDPQYHRKPSLVHMVDYIWSTPHYCVEGVRVVCGVSDHCAIVAEVSRALHNQG